MTMILIYGVCATVFLLLFLRIKMADAEDFLSAKVDELFAEWDKPNSPGAALAIVKDGSVAYKRGYGSANLEYDIAIDPTSVFSAASVSKQFTAFAITMLAHEGKLSLDDDIRKHLPEVPDFGETITVRHLIHHTSGLRNHSNLFQLAGWGVGYPVRTNDDVMEMVKHQKELNFSPGDEYLYCNTGYTLLAEIVERITELSFREYTEMNIFEPLGMAKTHFHDDRWMIVKNRAYSYDSTDGGFRKKFKTSMIVGNSSLFTTVDDLAKWVLNFDSGKVGSPAVIEQMHQQGYLNNGEMIDYAFGLHIGEYNPSSTVSD
ncbi:serine hydrolase domain-containing protein [Candidatus Poribacteria bacterium]